MDPVKVRQVLEVAAFLDVHAAHFQVIPVHQITPDDLKDLKNSPISASERQVVKKYHKILELTGDLQSTLIKMGHIIPETPRQQTPVGTTVRRLRPENLQIVPYMETIPEAPRALTAVARPFGVQAPWLRKFPLDWVAHVVREQWVRLLYKFCWRLSYYMLILAPLCVLCFLLFLTGSLAAYLVNHPELFAKLFVRFPIGITSYAMWAGERIVLQFVNDAVGISLSEGANFASMFGHPLSPFTSKLQCVYSGICMWFGRLNNLVVRSRRCPVLRTVQA